MTDETPPDDQKRNPLMEEAALWFARMRGPEADAHRQAFEAWLARGALHRSAYNRAGEIFSIGKFLEGEQLAGDACPEQVTVPAEEASRPAVRRRQLLSLLLLGAIVVVAIGWSWMARSNVGRFDPHNAVAKSEEQPSYRLSTDRAVITRRLSDGSTVTLQPDTILLVSFDDTRRAFHLQRGAAQFDVAHESRPFSVHAGGGTVTARGTLFEVRLTVDNSVTVKLIRGRVDVSTPRTALTTASVAHLKPGQTVSFSAESIPHSVTTTTSHHTPSTEVLEFDGLRLADLLARANAVNATKIRLSDPRAGARAVSGRFAIGDPQKLAERLAWIFGGKVSSEPTGNLVLSGL